METISKKVILTGSFGVGKTSLFNRFIHERFNDKYLTTIGVKVSKKEIEVDGRTLSILLWDVAGEVTQDKVPVSYFQGTSGIIYVFDLARPNTYKNMGSDLEYLQKLLPDASFCTCGNKKDMVTDEEITEIQNKLPVPLDIATSARTGENVEVLFNRLGKMMLGI